jgi:hypothetical protein
MHIVALELESNVESTYYSVTCDIEDRRIYFCEVNDLRPLATYPRVVEIYVRCKVPPN